MTVDSQVMSGDLYVPLAAGDVRLVPLIEAHREGLRSACAQDSEIWEIYSSSMAGEHFDPAFDAKLAGVGPQCAYSVFAGDLLVGCTSWYAIEPAHRAVAIGYTYLAPSVRSSGFNVTQKALMIRHAWGVGFHRIHFDVDTRNYRSMAAVRKLGGVPEGVLRHSKITWTGFVRDTAVFSILPGDESPALRAAIAALPAAR
jgi:RimJ/RimL family protein N-acetyltransferase